ncbi:permease [Shewanella sp. YIC-542]|uniref:permease n=1 Tax=Shewanella mytili TaxID=3377111 RepID=UPI00398EE5C1
MLAIFTLLADWLVYDVLALTPASRFGAALHFFVEDTAKIFVLLIVMIYVIALLRASLNVEKVRDYLAGKNRLTGYFLGSAFGAITPFCSCSSIPAFLGFTSAGIPVGITMAFLITSPLINEVAVLLLLGLLGWQFTVMYVLVGMLVGMVSGALLDAIHAERWLQSFAAKALQRGQQNGAGGAYTPASVKLNWQQRHHFATAETKEIVGRVWKWVFIGVGLGAALHGFVPDGWVEAHLGQGQWWSVPLAVLIGVPLYSNVTGIVPVMESLLLHGLPVGTTLAFCMATVAASFPEFILLKQVMQWRLLASVFGILLLAFTLIGWLFNLIGPVL